MIKRFLLIAAVVVSGCAGPQITTIQSVVDTADAPYGNVLVVSLFSSFARRRALETEIASQLTERGIKAVASTTMMDTRTPLNRETIVAMVKKLGSDAVLVTQLASLDTETKLKSGSPQATYNVRSTYYYNVWSVELTEYTEPPNLELKHSIVLATQLYSAKTQQPVWAIESSSKMTQNFDRRSGDTAVINEAKAVAGALARAGLLAE